MPIISALWGIEGKCHSVTNILTHNDKWENDNVDCSAEQNASLYNDVEEALFL